MALEPVFRELSVSLHRLRDALKALYVTMGDKPPHDDVALADNLESAGLDTMGSLQEALSPAKSALQAVRELPLDLDGARRELTVCQDRFDRVEQQISANLVAYEKLRELERLGTGRGGEWQHWAKSVKQGIEQCGQPLIDSRRALLHCWQQIVEHLAAELSAR
jgi:hypothetical protein